MRRIPHAASTHDVSSHEFSQMTYHDDAPVTKRISRATASAPDIEAPVCHVASRSATLALSRHATLALSRHATLALSRHATLALSRHATLALSRHTTLALSRHARPCHVTLRYDSCASPSHLILANLLVARLSRGVGIELCLHTQLGSCPFSVQCDWRTLQIPHPRYNRVFNSSLVLHYEFGTWLGLAAGMLTEPIWGRRLGKCATTC
jgi:hypothetical protein